MHAAPGPGHGRAPRGALVAVALALALCACTSLQIERDTQTSGTFRSRSWAFTIISIDLPRQALNTARENVADARLINARVDFVKITPNLGWWDWLMDIIGVRVATISGTWGFVGEE